METPSGPPVREKVHSRSRGGAAARRGGRTIYTTVLRIIQVVARCHWHFTPCADTAIAGRHISASTRQVLQVLHVFPFSFLPSSHSLPVIGSLDSVPNGY
jgi:hypothetical protein